LTTLHDRLYVDESIKHVSPLVLDHNPNYGGTIFRNINKNIKNIHIECVLDLRFPSVSFPNLVNFFIGEKVGNKLKNCYLEFCNAELIGQSPDDTIDEYENYFEFESENQEYVNFELYSMIKDKCIVKKVPFRCITCYSVDM
jgi:hypothetical protein